MCPDQLIPVPPKHSFQANGKVLLSGEYLVLDGALALGVPLQLGQRMSINVGSGSDITWVSHLPDGEIWFQAKFDLFGFDAVKTSNEELSDRLTEIFEAAVRLNSDFLSKWKKYKVKMEIDFDPSWGLGSSSTLISCIAEWADVDPYDLLDATFGGSGYDIACAKAHGPILYQRTESEIEVTSVKFAPRFADQLYLIYLGSKQTSSKEVAQYQELAAPSAIHIDTISQITRHIVDAKSLTEFEKLIVDHENLIGKLIGKKPVKAEYFSDYWGQIKSLGAWGGDFILATSDRPTEETRSYFNNLGFDLFFTYQELTSATVLEHLIV